MCRIKAPKCSSMQKKQGAAKQCQWQPPSESRCQWWCVDFQRLSERLSRLSAAAAAAPRASASASATAVTARPPGVAAVE